MSKFTDSEDTGVYSSKMMGNNYTNTRNNRRPTCSIQKQVCN